MSATGIVELALKNAMETLVDPACNSSSKVENHTAAAALSAENGQIPAGSIVDDDSGDSHVNLTASIAQIEAVSDDSRILLKSLLERLAVTTVQAAEIREAVEAVTLSLTESRQDEFLQALSAGLFSQGDYGHVIKAIVNDLAQSPDDPGLRRLVEHLLIAKKNLLPPDDQSQFESIISQLSNGANASGQLLENCRSLLRDGVDQLLPPAQRLPDNGGQDCDDDDDDDDDGDDDD